MKKPKPLFFTELQNNQVQNLPTTFSEESFIEWGANQQNVVRHISSFLQIKGENFTGLGPIEKNPNIDRHIDDFDLSRKFLMLGPFPSSQYLVNPNLLKYFYADNLELWDYLFELVDGDVTVDNIKKELKNRSISITDVFAFVQRKSFVKESPNQNLSNIILNSAVLNVFDPQSKVTTILTFSGTLKDFVNNSEQTNTTCGLRWIIDAFKDDFYISPSEGGPFYELNNNNVIELSNYIKGIEWWIKRSNNTPIKVVSLPSPSKNARRRMKLSVFFRKWVNSKFENIDVLGLNTNELNSFISQNPQVFGDEAPTTKYRREVYAKALANELDQI